MPDRISRKQLEGITRTLSNRDKDILVSIRECRYLTTDQICRLHFTKSSTASAGLRATSRNLNKLKDLGLIGTLQRRIGGVRAGSSANVWRLSAAGEHLLRLMNHENHTRRKRLEPSTHFLAHTLAVSECFIQITEICQKRGIRLAGLQMEPDCWRSYSSSGKIVALKPDLFVITACGGYEDRWFLEMDLATESPMRILEKAQRYFQYYRSGLEQKEHGVFPLVVWIVPDENRKRSVSEHIKAEFAKLPQLFVTITPDELEGLIGQDIGSP